MPACVGGHCRCVNVESCVRRRAMVRPLQVAGAGVRQGGHQAAGRGVSYQAGQGRRHARAGVGRELRSQGLPHAQVLQERKPH